MKRTIALNRRQLLRGAGVALALPALSANAKATPPEAPARLSVFYFPNGMRMDEFRPSRAGGDYPLPEMLAPLAGQRQDFSVVTGLAHYNAQALGDPGGDHGRSCAAYLTGAHPRPTEGSDLRCGVSMDQQVAAVLGRDTPYPSLELGIEHSSLLGSCDIGFSCTYTNTLSWRTPTQALPVTVNPRAVFERLIGEGGALSGAARDAYFQQRRSVLDYVMEGAARLERKVGASERRKLDEYLTSVREVERRVQRIGAQPQDLKRDELVLPAGVPDDFETHVRLMIDLQILAFRTDLTRVSTFMLGRELSNRTYPEIGVSDSHHSLSHHGGDREKIGKLVQISQFHWRQFGYLLQRLKTTPDGPSGDTSLLDTTVVLAGASLGEPNEHNCMDLPAVVAGGGQPRGQHIALPEKTPMSNLLLTLMQNLGVPAQRFGDSTGAIEALQRTAPGQA